MALHGENLKMGKDVRGVERGKCASGECEDFMRSDGAPCGYCRCLATCNSKKDARYSSDSVGSTLGPFSAAFQKWTRPKILRIWNMTLIKIEILSHRAYISSARIMAKACDE